VKARFAQLTARLFSLDAALTLALITSVAAISASFHAGTLVAYNDASAHLNTARRVIDSLTPSFVQLGSVWLPLLHILLIPFVWFDILWHTGLAGSIVSGSSFLLATFFMYKLVLFYTRKPVAAFIATLVFLLNLNFLYLQTTAMFEPLLIALVLGGVYYLAVWSATAAAGPLVGAAVFTMLASLTRYDGWAFFAAASAYVALVSLVKHHRATIGNLVLYGSLACFGIVLWLLYNQLIFGDALYFAHSEFSAAAQQTVLHDRGQLPTQHYLGLSIATYSAATLLNLGIVVSAIGLIGAILYWCKQLFRLERWALLLLLVPFAFNSFTLWAGQSVIWVPMIAPHFDTYFNARYGILMLPAAAFFIGWLAAQNLGLRLILPLILIAQTAFMAVPNQLPIFGNQTGIVALRDTVASVNQQTIAASTYLHDHYQGGLILCSTASSDAFIYRSGINLSNYITEGTGRYWSQSLNNPSAHAEWVVIFGNRTDRVGSRMGDDPDKLRSYRKVYADDTYEIWKLRS
jgi:hypothetical protein